MQCVEGKSEWKKQHMVPNVCQNRKPYRTQILFHVSVSPPPILGTTENAIFAQFIKKSMHLKTRLLLDYQVDHKSKQVYSLIDRFMTSEGNCTLILPFTSKTGQSVAQNRQKIFFNLGFTIKEGTYFSIL